MIRNYFVAFCVFALSSITLLGGGITGLVFSIKHYNDTRELEKSEIIENAIITHFVRRSNTSNYLIYFTTQNEGKTYRYNLFKVPFTKIKAGDEIEVKFNKNRTLFLITDYSSAFYAGYIVQIVLFVVCIILSVFFILGTIEIYNKM